MEINNEHILDILDSEAFAELSESEKALIDEHTKECQSCFQAYRAAQISFALLKTDVARFEPSPFFQTRVMANLREKQISRNPFAAFGRIWKASRTLVAGMMMTIFALIALTVFAPEFNKVSASTSEINGYSTEMVILDERVSSKEPTNEQVFQMIYGTERNSDK